MVHRLLPQGWGGAGRGGTGRVVGARETGGAEERPRKSERGLEREESTTETIDVEFLSVPARALVASPRSAPPPASDPASETLYMHGAVQRWRCCWVVAL